MFNIVFVLPLACCNMKSSLRMDEAVNEIDTMCRSSFLKSTRDMIMIAAHSGLYKIKDKMAEKKNGCW